MAYVYNPRLEERDDAIFSGWMGLVVLFALAATVVPEGPYRDGCVAAALLTFFVPIAAVAVVLIGCLLLVAVVDFVHAVILFGGWLARLVTSCR